MKLASPALFRRAILLAMVTLAADQLHKWYMLEHTSVGDQPIEVMPFFRLVMVWNTGISFGMFRTSPYSPYIFSSISLAIVIILLIWLSKTVNKIDAFAIGAICGGAIGNIVDRLRYGAVADFFDAHIGDLHWPAFNIADSAVFIGAVILCCTSLLTGKKQEQVSGTGSRNDSC